MLFDGSWWWLMVLVNDGSAVGWMRRWCLANREGRGTVAGLDDGPNWWFIPVQFPIPYSQAGWGPKLYWEGILAAIFRPLFYTNWCYWAMIRSMLIISHIGNWITCYGKPDGGLLIWISHDWWVSLTIITLWISHYAYSFSISGLFPADINRWWTTG